MEHTRRPSTVLPVILTLAVLALACPPPAMNSSQRAAYLQSQVVDALGALQSAAIQANGTTDPDTHQPVLSEPVTRRVVQMTVRALEVASQRPDAWPTTVRGLVAGVEATLSPHDAARLSPYFSAIRVTLDSLEARP